jgi:CDP-diacylglycerol--serine O-phosphatidyltransferase
MTDPLRSNEVPLALQRMKRLQRWRRARRRAVPPMSVLPTLCTLANLLCGFASIHYALKPHDFQGIGGWSGLTVAGALVFLGMFFDAIDGSVARITRSTSELGAQLDSLADVVTFGLAPAFMMLQLVHLYVADETGVTIIGPEADSAFGKLMWAVAAMYVCCAALRLARFGAETTAAVEDHLSFRGLPTPGAAGVVASLIILHQHLFVARFHGDVTDAFARVSAFGIPLAVFLAALAMVSTIKYDHVVNRYLLGRRSFTYIARLVIIAVVSIWWLRVALPVIFITYGLSGPAYFLMNVWRRRHAPGLRATASSTASSPVLSHGPSRRP